MVELIKSSKFKFQRIWGPVPRYPKVQSYQRNESSSQGLLVVAGPCSIESADQIYRIACELKKYKVDYLRGGVFRAGTYPNKKRGFGFVEEKLINEFSRAAHENGMRCVIEVLDYHPDVMRMIDKYADAYQVGARQMQNYTLLNVLSHKKRPIFLKRNMGSTIDEFLGSAEWLLQNNCPDVILVERGSSTFLNHVRWDLSISMIPAIKQLTDIPIIIDGSHGTGRRDLVEPMTLAGIAAGANGFLIETHYDPDNSLSDSDQALPLDDSGKLIIKANRIFEILKVPCEN